MDVYLTTCEFAYTTLTSEDEPLDGVVQVALLPWATEPDDVTVWTDAEWVGSPALVRRFRVLLAGRQVAAPAGAVQPTSPGKYRQWLRLPNVPQVVVKPGGPVTVH